MGWASEMNIEEHNEMLESSEYYREAYALHLADIGANVWDNTVDETLTEWFPDRRLAFNGFEEFDD